MKQEKIATHRKNNPVVKAIKDMKWTADKVKAFNEYKPVHELTPELADKIWASVKKKQYDKKVSQEMVLHHLKQIKAQMGKLKSKTGSEEAKTWYNTGIESCMKVIDKKIAKINGK